MTNLFEMFDRADPVSRGKSTGLVRCLRHADLAFELRSDTHVGIVLNLSSGHGVTGQVDGSPAVAAPAVGRVTTIPPCHSFAFRVSGSCRVVALHLPVADLPLRSGNSPLRPRVNADDPALTGLILTTAAATTQAAQTNGLAAIGRHLLAAGRAGAGDEPPVPARGGIPPARLRRVMQVVETNLHAPMPLATMAAEAGMSLHHFARSFAASTGWPPHRFFVRQRVHRAVELLGDRSLAVGEVAAQMGFAHHSHLARTMRRFLGVTPEMLRDGILA